MLRKTRESIVGREVIKGWWTRVGGGGDVDRRGKEMIGGDAGVELEGGGVMQGWNWKEEVG